MPEVPEACSPTRTLMPTMTSRLASATSTASIGSISRISSLSPTMTRCEKRVDAGVRDVQIGEDAHLARLDHVLAEAREIARAGAAGVDRRGDAGGAAELLGVDAERGAAPIDMGVQVDQARA